VGGEWEGGVGGSGRGRGVKEIVRGVWARCEMALREVCLISDRPESTVYPEEPYRLSVTSLVGLRCVPDASRGFLTELDLSKVPG
jgi:hypothetical protein